MKYFNHSENKKDIQNLNKKFYSHLEDLEITILTASSDFFQIFF